MKIILTQGLPGSGKTTYARQHQQEHPDTVRVNKDELRNTLHNGVWSHGKEKFILKIRDMIIINALSDGHDVIVDDTNFAKKHIYRIQELALEYEAQVEVKSFMDVPIEECIKNDLKRPNSVGEQVIRKMYQQYLQPKEKYNPDPELPEAIVFDVDGTLALFGDNNPYDRDFLQDNLNEPVALMFSYLRDYYKIIFVSGRSDKFRKDTVTWLRQNLDMLKKDVEDNLYMRKEGDKRKDVIVKGEIFEQYIKDKYRIKLILDDRNQMVEYWRSKGIPCFQVAEGNF